MIEISELTKYYGDLCALDHIDLTIERGKILGLLGPQSAEDLSPSRAVAAALPACDPPSITAHPESATVCEGLVVEFTVEAEDPLDKGVLAGLPSVEGVARDGAAWHLTDSILRSG